MEQNVKHLGQVRLFLVFWSLTRALREKRMWKMSDAVFQKNWWKRSDIPSTFNATQNKIQHSLVLRSNKISYEGKNS